MKKLILCVLGVFALHIAFADDTSQQPPALSLGTTAQEMVPVLKPAKASVLINFFPNSWRGKPGAYYAFQTHHAADGKSYQEFFDGNAWWKFSNFNEVKPLKTVTIDDVRDFEWTLYASTASVQDAWAEVDFCVSLDAAALNPYDPMTSVCGATNFDFRGVDVSTPLTASGTLRAASVALSNGGALGRAESLTAVSGPSSVEFELFTPPQAGAIVVAADGLDPAIRNISLSGVSVTLYPYSEGRGYSSFPMVRMVNGKPDFSGLHPFNAQLLNAPAPMLDQALSNLGTQMGFRPGMSATDYMSRFDDLGATLSGMKKDAYQQFQGALYSGSLPNLMMVMNAGVAFNTRGGAFPAGYLAVHPTSKRFKIVVEAAAGTQPFRILAIGLPLNAGTQTSWAATPEFAQTSQAGLAAEGERVLRAQFDAASPAVLENLLTESSSSLIRAPGGLDPTPWDPPAKCKDRLNSTGIKAFVELDLAMLTTGLTMEATEAVAGIGALGITTQGANTIGVFAGIGQSVLTGVSDWWDFGKFGLKFLATSATMPEIARAELKVANPNLCIDPVLDQDKGRDHTEVTLEWFNPCDMPLYGAGGPDFLPRVTPAQVGDLTTEGYLHGAGDFWGSGAKYNFQAMTVGTATIEVKVPIGNQLQTFSKTVNVTKCASPTKPH